MRSSWMMLKKNARKRREASKHSEKGKIGWKLVSDCPMCGVRQTVGAGQKIASGPVKCGHTWTLRVGA